MKLSDIKVVVVSLPMNATNDYAEWAEVEFILHNGNSVYLQSIGRQILPRANNVEMWSDFSDRTRKIGIVVEPKPGDSNTIGECAIEEEKSRVKGVRPLALRPKQNNRDSRG